MNGKLTCEECGFVGEEKLFCRITEYDSSYYLCEACLEKIEDSYDQLQDAIEEGLSNDY